MRRRIGATSATLVNPNDFAGDPHYGYKPLRFHGKRALDAIDAERRAAARVERRRGFAKVAA